MAKNKKEFASAETAEDFARALQARMDAADGVSIADAKVADLIAQLRGWITVGKTSKAPAVEPPTPIAPPPVVEEPVW